MDNKQLAFSTILNDAFAQYERRIAHYCLNNKDKYVGMAKMITPDLSDKEAVYARIAFAILSANAPFDDAVKALGVAIKKKDKLQWRDIVWYKQVPAKAKYCVEAWRLIRQDSCIATKDNDESWHEYRLRLKREFKGLGLAKASFAACLLYPLEADLACVDTWIQKVFLGHTGFKSLGLRDYLTVEAKIRTYAACFDVSTFIAQWLIWDHARGGVANSHAIFPGSHK